MRDELIFQCTYRAACVLYCCQSILLSSGVRLGVQGSGRMLMDLLAVFSHCALIFINMET